MSIQQWSIFIPLLELFQYKLCSRIRWALAIAGRRKENRPNKRRKWNTKQTAHKTHLLQCILCVRLQNESAAIKKRTKCSMWFSVGGRLFSCRFYSLSFGDEFNVYVPILVSHFYFHCGHIHILQSQFQRGKQLFTKTRQIHTHSLALTAMMKGEKNACIYPSIFPQPEFLAIFLGIVDQHTNLQHIQTAVGLCFTRFCCIVVCRLRLSRSRRTLWCSSSSAAFEPHIYVSFLVQPLQTLPNEWCGT